MYIYNVCVGVCLTTYNYINICLYMYTIYIYMYKCADHGHAWSTWKQWQVPAAVTRSRTSELSASHGDISGSVASCWGIWEERVNKSMIAACCSIL